ncbi:MAG: type 1 glutamine amidotransferase [Actinobacteria bacterium]|nr:type 1 glutamine amidotransferase [Actinomycetota bacterium]
MKVLALTHGPSVGTGVFGEAIRDAGHELAEWCVPLGGEPPAAADAVLVFGGAMHADQEERHPWLLGELRFLEAALERELPLFGVCLGAQLLAKAAGADVHPAAESEVGWFEVELTAAADDPVFGSLPARFDAFQWHHYTYGLPAGATELARSAVCTQAFRLGRAYGIQFHAEVTGPQIEQWLGEDPGDVADPEALRRETAARIADWNELGRGLCRAFLETV